MVERHPRSAFELVTKMPLRDFKDTADLETIFNEQRTNCGVDYFDYYLLHNMGTNVYEKCRKYGAFDFIAAKKAEGKIKHAGMSFHDTRNFLTKSSRSMPTSLILYSCRLTILTGNSPMYNRAAAWKLPTNTISRFWLWNPAKEEH